jgi:hypothetical protein
LAILGGRFRAARAIEAYASQRDDPEFTTVSANPPEFQDRAYVLSGPDMKSIMTETAYALRVDTVQGELHAHPYTWRRSRIIPTQTWSFDMLSELELTEADAKLVRDTITFRSRDHAPRIVKDVNTLLGYFALARPIEAA